jgi:hypothetical protein
MPWYAWCLLFLNIGLSVYSLIRSRIAIAKADEAKLHVTRRFV